MFGKMGSGSIKRAAKSFAVYDVEHLHVESSAVQSQEFYGFIYPTLPSL